ncbi:6101_t:CDS:2 [Acaulospora colombiana]|uniref:6101_t:CDS:1 n=1 Tax=Acaulospora colombiana TaxID=27376 RepID=A0ACA9LYK9_9GLOM|nr:6101_t:CDS:2 [Acaulospora colombiana]
MYVNPCLNPKQKEDLMLLEEKDNEDPDYVYDHDNTEQRGFGHIAIGVDNIEAACKRFEELQVEFTKRLQDGKMKNIAFIKDPDGYMIEIIQKGRDVKKTELLGKNDA